MIGPLDELKTRISDLEADFSFVSHAARLRPRMGAVVQWQATGSELVLARQFMDAKSSRPEGLYGPLLVRLLAAFERYLRMLIVQSVEQRAANVHSFDDLPTTLSSRNVILTGRVLAAMDNPRDHLTVDINVLISNLATCSQGSRGFRLNSLAFAATVTGAGPSIIERALLNVNVSDWWDAVGGNSALAGLLGTKGARATGDRARERLRELWRWRNHLAHGGDEEVAISESQLQEAIGFIACFGSTLDNVVKKKLKEQ